MRWLWLSVVVSLSGCVFFDELDPEPTGGGGGSSGVGGTGGGSSGGGSGGGGGSSSTPAANFELTARANGTVRLNAQTSLGPVSADFDSVVVTATRLVDDPLQGVEVTLIADSVPCSLPILHAELGATNAALGRTWTTSGLLYTTTASTSCILKSADGMVQLQNLEAFTGTVSVTGQVRPGYRPEVGEVDYQLELRATARGLLGDSTTIREDVATLTFQASGTVVDVDCTLLNGRPCDPPPTGGGAGTTGGGTGSGGGTGGSCADVPRTYIGDVQFDTICAAAVCYQRTGNSAGVQASCQSLSGLSGPSPSQCPAC